MVWNYRLIEYRYIDDEIDLAVHEVYYNEDGAPFAFSENAIAPFSKEDAQLILEAYDKPPVAYIDKRRLDEGQDDWGWL